MKQVGRNDKTAVSFPLTPEGSGLLLWPGGRIKDTFGPHFSTPNLQHFYFPPTVAFSKL